MRFIPLGHRVLVKPEKVEEKTRGGLFVPEHTLERKQAEDIYGTGVDVGQTAWKAFDDGNPWAAVGDEVVFAKYGGFLLKDEDGNEFRILNDEDLVAKIER